MKRRNFVKYGVSSLFLAPIIANGYPPLYLDKYASRVVSVHDGKATALETQAANVLNSDGVYVDQVLSWKMNDLRIKRMFDEALLQLTDQKSVGKAWESLFPKGQLNATTRIGIKLNFSYGDWKNDQLNKWSRMYCPFGPKSALTNAMVAGLTQMLDGTFPVENITFIERMYSVGERKYFPVVQGYKPVFENDDGLFIDKPAGAPGQHWIYAASPLELPEGGPSFIAAPDYPEQYQAPQRIYAAYYQQDFLINYAIGKDHRAAGITGVMKNNYGCTDNPVGTHGTSEWRTDNSPYAGTGRCVPVFHKNVDQYAPYILNILDALSIVYAGGPLSGQVENTNTIAVSKDPVAIDRLLLEMINKARKTKGMSPIQATDGRTPEGHPNASFLRVASENHELGSMSLDNVQHMDMSSKKLESKPPKMARSQSYIGNVRMAGSGYQVDLFLDGSKDQHHIESKILDMRGRTVKAHATQKHRESAITLEWNHKTDDNELAKEGVYIWLISVDGRVHNCTVNDYYLA